MYYEEKIIDGVLHCRSTPYEEWRPFSAEVLTTMLKEARGELASINIKLENICEAVESHLQKC